MIMNNINGKNYKIFNTDHNKNILQAKLRVGRMICSFYQAVFQKYSDHRAIPYAKTVDLKDVEKLNSSVENLFELW